MVPHRAVPAPDHLRLDDAVRWHAALRVAVAFNVEEASQPNEELTASESREIMDLRMQRMGVALWQNGLFVEFSPCLSRACLGKIIFLMYKWLKKPVFSPLQRSEHQSRSG